MSAAYADNNAAPVWFAEPPPKSELVEGADQVIRFAVARLIRKIIVL